MQRNQKDFETTELAAHALLGVIGVVMVYNRQRMRASLHGDYNFGWQRGNVPFRMDFVNHVGVHFLSLWNQKGLVAAVVEKSHYNWVRRQRGMKAGGAVRWLQFFQK